MISAVVTLAWLRRWWWAVMLASLGIALATIAFWPHPKPQTPVVPPEVVETARAAERHEGAADVLERQAEAVGVRADAIEQEIRQTKPRPKAKPLETENDEEVARDVSDVLRSIAR